MSSTVEKLTFSINDKSQEYSIAGCPPFRFGKDELLSNSANDITFKQDWYQEGHKSIDFLTTEEFAKLKTGLSRCVQKIIQKELGTSTDNFELESYHKFIPTNEDHFKIVSKTRDLFPEDFDFPIMKTIDHIGKLLGMELTDIDPKTNKQLHIIVRINRPRSKDFNPPHKDIYEAVDKFDYIPQFVNLWIPISGVTDKSSLPIAPKSHLVNEKNVLRTFDGGVVEGNQYRVRMIKEWGGSSDLVRAKVDYGQALFFSSHLVHGLASNEEDDTTRISLEFRLFKKE